MLDHPGDARLGWLSCPMMGRWGGDGVWWWWWYAILSVTVLLVALLLPHCVIGLSWTHFLEASVSVKKSAI
jgi:hypothetical protein